MDIAIIYSLMFVLTALAILLIGYGSLLFAMGLWSRYWPSVPGIIESSILQTGTNINGLRAYWVETKYTYHWDIPRRGSWIGFSHPGSASNSKLTKSKAEALHAILVPGSQVDVFVCPRMPTIAVLRCGHNLASLGYIALSPIFAALPLWLAWLYWRG